jgi:hypothetical protein
MRATFQCVVFAVALLTCATVMAAGVTVDQIIALSKAGVSDDVIVAMIEQDKSVYSIEPERLIALRREGVSERVVLAMVKSGRETAPAPQAATLPLPIPVLPPTIGPDIVIVGHAPDRPNVGGLYFADADVVPVGAAAYAPYAFLVPPTRCVTDGRSRVTANSDGAVPGRFMSDPAARFTSDPTARFQNNGFIPRVEPDSQPFVSCSPELRRSHQRH